MFLFVLLLAVLGLGMWGAETLARRCRIRAAAKR
jgi:hypothetical protein